MKSKTKKFISMLLLLIVLSGAVFIGAPFAAIAEDEPFSETGQTIENETLPGTDLYDIRYLEDILALGINPSDLEIKEEVKSVIAQAFDAIVKPLAEAGVSFSLTPQYGSNGKFLAPIEPIAAGSIPISDRAGLEAIADNLSGNYHLTQDIDLSGAEWTPIGYNSYSNSFSGIFDGQGYVIRNLAITDDYQYAGLFGYSMDGTIKNLGLEDTNINITGSSYSYLYTGGICGLSYSTISNCYNSGFVIVPSSSSWSYTGGICGYSTYSAISKCYNNASVAPYTLSNSSSDVGGICGHSINYSIISNCYNYGSIAASSTKFSSSPNVGGICGESSGSSSTINNCYNIGSVTASSSNSTANAGGICGISTSPVNNCHNYGSVTVSSSSHQSVVGGICGFLSSIVSNCYNSGSITASTYSSSYTGGICGQSDAATISKCYNSGSVATSTSGTYSITSSSGGICGYAHSISSSSVISQCQNSGSVNASSTGDYNNLYAGGISGEVSTSAALSGTTTITITDCYNSGSVTASSSSDATVTYAGGVCGRSFTTAISTASIINCYNTGSVTTSSSDTDAVSYVGGICGFITTETTVSNCYWMPESVQTVNDVSLSNADKRRVGNEEDSLSGRLTSEQMKSAANFTGFDFDTVWDMTNSINNGYPHLRNLLPDGGDAVLLGDVNGDGIINMQDVLLIYQQFRGKTNLDEAGLAAADVNGDDAINMMDVLMVYQYFRGKITEFTSQQ